ncbi:hypothetical protein [Streptomyces sp. NPDC051577]|uniref:hypothetical protein n=1 Tax=Streptomyces sp. NPDC051577 TaxID=3155166 RepID=UPI0034401D04
MEDTPMPEPLRRAVHQLVAEAVTNCQEVLSYTEPFATHDWQRMTLYRATDAADTMNMAALLVAAYCHDTGMTEGELEGCLQLGQQRNRAAGPREADRAQLAGLLGRPAPTPSSEPGVVMMRYSRGQNQAQRAQYPEDDRQKLFTEAVLHGLKASLCDDLDALEDHLPSHIARMARRVAEALEESQPAMT